MGRAGRCPGFGAWTTALLGYFVGRALAIPTVEVKGSKFFTSEGSQFFIKGVAYSPEITELNNLVDEDLCKRDAKLISNLGANVIRVYTVDPTLNHDACMSAFEEEGIYIVIDFASPTTFISRSDPEWTMELRDQFAKVIDGFAKYDNLLAFFGGNEVINDADTSQAAPYVKAAIADMKAYRDLQGYRNIPIGYSASDEASLRSLQMDYFSCGDSNSSADFFATNLYSWCFDNSTMATAGYDQLYEELEGYPIPYFLSETGCNMEGTSDEPYRTFKDQRAVLGRDMNDRLSGNIIYEFLNHVNVYGLVEEQSNRDVKLLEDYDRLKDVWRTLSPDGVAKTNYEPASTTRRCPESTSGTWEVAASATLPTLGLSGFPTPTAKRYTSSSALSGTRTGSDAVSATVEGISGKSGNPGPVDSEQSSSGLSTGGIAGAVVGSLVVIALILGSILFCLHRKKKQRRAFAPEGPDPDSDKMVAGTEEHFNNKPFVDYYGPNYPELPPNQHPSELDPSKGTAVTMPANEMSGTAYSEMANGNENKSEQDGPPPMTQTPATTEPSPFVQRQREMEMDWLESEEARLRQRRELLQQQGGGGS